MCSVRITSPFLTLVVVLLIPGSEMFSVVVPSSEYVYSVRFSFAVPSFSTLLIGVLPSSAYEISTVDCILSPAFISTLSFNNFLFLSKNFVVVLPSPSD